MRLEQSVEMAILDPLTGLHNRRYMTSHLATLFEDASQRGKPLSVLLIDIDHFKAVNDSHGHDAGDAVLQEFARIRRNTRGIDLACRLGGEEFVVVMPDCWPRPIRSASACANASRRLRSRLGGRSAGWTSRRALGSLRSNLTTTPRSSC